MPIILLTPGFPKDESDTTCVPYLQVWVKEALKKFDISIIAFQYPFEEKHYNWNGVPVYSAGGKNQKFPWRLIVWYRVIRQFFKWQKEKPFQRILSFWVTEAALVAGWLGRFTKISHDCWILGQDARKENKYPTWLPSQNIYFISISPSLSQDFEQNHHKRIAALIPLGLSIPPPESVQAQVRKIDIVGLGSLTPLKRFDDFITIIAKLKRDFPHIQAAIIGEGPEKERLLSKVKEDNLTENITFFGLLAHASVFEVLRQSKILLHTSSYEGQGVAYWEALASGCYVAAKPVGFLPENLKAFKNSDLTILSQKIKEWLSLTSPDYTPFVYEMEQTIGEYQKFVENNP